ncbi:MAG TPA: hypothetical protein VF190_12615 [Rhodothermales bacterium]
MKAKPDGVRVKGATVRRRIGLALAVASSALVFYGCDTLSEGGETLVLQPKEVTFRFEFSGDDLSAGQTVTVNSVNVADLADELLDDGYEKNEVVGAQVSSAEIRRVSTNYSLNELSDVSIELRATGLSAATVASASSLPNQTTASLNVGPTRDVESFVRQPSFSAVAEFSQSGLGPGDYVLSVTLELRIEVESL